MTPVGLCGAQQERRRALPRRRKHSSERADLNWVAQRRARAVQLRALERVGAQARIDQGGPDDLRHCIH